MSDELLNEMNRTLGKLDGKMDAVISAQQDHGSRLVTVEGKVNHILGWATGLGAAAGAFASYLKTKLGGT